MYKFFLCLRYLRRRYLALIAAASVALCVAMVLIVVSVMDGFLRKVEDAAKGLYGDIVMEGGLAGIGRYDEFIDYLKGAVPEVEAATPMIFSYGLLRIGETFTEPVSICGIRLPERLKVTDFGQGLFAQAGRPDASFDPLLEQLIAATQQHVALMEKVRAQETAIPADKRDSDRLEKLTIAQGNAPQTLDILENALLKQRLAKRLRADLAAEQAKPPDKRDAGRIAGLVEQIDRLTNEIKYVRERVAQVRSDLADEEAKTPEKRKPGAIEKLTAQVNDLTREMDRLVRPPSDRVILGLGIGGLSFRTPEGDTIRLVTPGRNVVLTLLPIAHGLPSAVTPNSATLTVIDDAKTDVYTIDSKTVYMPLDTLQALAEMDERTDEVTRKVYPPRCSQIQIKVKPAYASERRLVGARLKVQNAWREFVRQRPEAQQSRVAVQTWRERLDKYIGPIEKQRTLVTLMFGIISFVSVLLIFAIFYMIVVQKTRDIGIVRAVGGSSGGVAQIFLGYGAATGVVGSVVGLTIGYFFVRYINEIQDWLASWSGFRVWDRDVFMFDRIPNQVDPSVAAVIALWAVASGLVGALIPGVRAAIMEPVEAIRYE